MLERFRQNNLQELINSKYCQIVIIVISNRQELGLCKKATDKTIHGNSSLISVSVFNARHTPDICHYFDTTTILAQNFDTKKNKLQHN